MFIEAPFKVGDRVIIHLPDTIFHNHLGTVSKVFPDRSCTVDYGKLQPNGYSRPRSQDGFAHQHLRLLSIPKRLDLCL